MQRIVLTCVVKVVGPQHPDNRGGTPFILEKLKEKCSPLDE